MFDRETPLCCLQPVRFCILWSIGQIQNTFNRSLEHITVYMRLLNNLSLQTLLIISRTTFLLY